MARLPWKKDKVFAVETRPRLWAIGQMLENPYLAFFDVFSRKPTELAIDLETCGILFICGEIQFISCSNTLRLKLAPRTSIPIPRRWIHAFDFDDRRSAQALKTWGPCHGPDDECMVVFGGTKHERKIWNDLGAYLVERNSRSYNPRFVADIDPNDEATVASYELTNGRLYPELNERLYLCYKLRKNVDPLKDMILRRPIPLIYKRYVDITES
jgi:hypothetical protein